MELGGSQYGAPQMIVVGGDSGQTTEAASPITTRPLPQNLQELVLGEEDAERGATPGNRWPRQETLALLKIRSEMDSAFREASLKAPLWEDVSRRLALLGYRRSSKKCKEKFENVHKYYKRTKDSRAGRQDGRSYRFFTQLEALHPTTAAASSAPAAARPDIVASSSRIQLAFPISSAPPPLGSTGISFSSNSSSSSGDIDSDDSLSEGRKRKRSSGESRTQKMMALFEGLMKQVIANQEAMQQRFLETIEKREQEWMVREETWRRQETARLSREHELIAQERAMAASRDATIIAFLQKITGQSIHLPAAPAAAPPHPPAVEQQQQSRPPPSPQKQQHHSTELVPFQEPHELSALVMAEPGAAAPSSRWPKPEVHALIKLRSALEGRYQETGPKGPLWEEISSEMQKLGYSRSSKRCKEKWENINKYFKKVKESNKKRPEDSKTCPYFHLLDALYLKKIAGAVPVMGPPPQMQDQQLPSHLLPTLLPLPQPLPAEAGTDTDVKSTSTATAMNDSDNMEEDEDDDDEEDNRTQYKIEFQRQDLGNGSSEVPAPTSSAAGSFLAMVQ